MSTQTLTGRDLYHTRPVLALGISIMHGISCDAAVRMAGVKAPVSKESQRQTRSRRKKQQSKS